VSPEERQSGIVEEWSVIPDVYERFSVLVGRAAPAELVAGETERVDESLVEGCQSQLWLVGEERDGQFFYRSFSEAPVVAALATLFCEVYSGSTATEVAGFEPDFLDALNLTMHLTPNRREGMRRVVARMRELAGVPGE
jgi:cysteine desulfuration protein SufE